MVTIEQLVEPIARVHDRMRNAVVAATEGAVLSQRTPDLQPSMLMMQAIPSMPSTASARSNSSRPLRARSRLCHLWS